MKRLDFVTVFVAGLMLAGCMHNPPSPGPGPTPAPGPNPTIITLEAIGAGAAAAIVTVPLLAAAGQISQDDATLIADVALKVSNAVPQAIQEVKSTDTPLQQSIKIKSYFQPALNTVIGNTVSPKAAAIVVAIDTSITVFIDQLGSQGVSFAARGTGPAKSIAPSFSKSDLARFDRLVESSKETNIHSQAWISEHKQ